MSEPTGAAAGKGEVEKIVADLMAEIRDNTASHPALPSRGMRAAKYGLFCALTVAALVAWIAPPAWLAPRAPAAPSHVKRVASLRVLIGLTAQRVDAFRASHHRLPVTAIELGVSNPALHYTKLDSATFTISGVVERDTITYHSTMPRQQFLGNSISVVQTSR